MVPPLNIKAFGLAAGVLWGLAILIWTMLAVYTGLAKEFLEMFTYLPGYGITVGGAFIGLIYGFIEGLICGAIFAWFYNQFI